MTDNETIETSSAPEDQLTQLTQLTHETETLRAQLAETEQNHAAERALIAAGAIDVDIAAPLIIAAIAAAKIDEQPAKAATKAVSELKARKPFLFAASATPRIAGAMAPAPRIASTQPTREQLAEQARTTGDRGALLRYLKSRRVA